MNEELSKNLGKELTAEQKSVLHSLRTSRMIIPVLLGLGAVIWLALRHFDFSKLNEIDYNFETFSWIALAAGLLVLRHLAFSTRMWILAQGHFSFRKCVELIFIFEFSLCVTPTTIGGSAVSLFVLTQEKLSAARTTTIVLYKVVLDTLFFVGTFPILFFLCGAEVIRPDMKSLFDGNWESRLFFFSYLGMVGYGLMLFYGLFIQPKIIKNILVWFTNSRLVGWSVGRLVAVKSVIKHTRPTHQPTNRLTDLKDRAENLGSEIITASVEMKNISWKQHAAAFLATWVAWTCKFLLISCIIYGIDAPELTAGRELLLYARLQAMFIIMAFSPTPGGAGFAETLFYPFLKDFISGVEIATVIALIWRLMSYYCYLAFGAMIIPNWIRKVFIANMKKGNDEQ